MFIEQLWENPDVYLTHVTIVAFSICFHELSHVWMAMHQGDMTAYRQGYLTLNPLKVMGRRPLLMLALVGIAWGAVPVDPRAMRRCYSHVLVACTGPVANLVLALVCTLVTAVLTLYIGPGEVVDTFRGVALVGVQVNFLLFMLNMLPVPMFDGWQLYAWVFPQVKRLDPRTLASFTTVAILLIFLTPIGSHLWGAADTLAYRAIRFALRALPAAA